MGGCPVNTSLGEVERCFEMSRRACCSAWPCGCRGRRPVPVQGGMRRPGPSSPVSRRLLPQVDDLKAKLAIQEAELKQKNENADKLIQVVGVETEKVSKEKAIADEEEIKVEVINKVGRWGLPGRECAFPNQQNSPEEGGCLPSTGPPVRRRLSPREMLQSGVPRPRGQHPRELAEVLVLRPGWAPPC